MEVPEFNAMQYLHWTHLDFRPEQETPVRIGLVPPISLLQNFIRLRSLLKPNMLTIVRVIRHLTGEELRPGELYGWCNVFRPSH